MTQWVRRLGPAKNVNNLKIRSAKGLVTCYRGADGALRLSIMEQDDRHVLLVFEDEAGSRDFALDVLKAIYPNDRTVADLIASVRSGQ